MISPDGVPSGEITLWFLIRHIGRALQELWNEPRYPFPTDRQRIRRGAPYAPHSDDFNGTPWRSVEKRNRG